MPVKEKKASFFNHLLKRKSSKNDNKNIVNKNKNENKNVPSSEGTNTAPVPSQSGANQMTPKQMKVAEKAKEAHRQMMQQEADKKAREANRQMMEQEAEKKREERKRISEEARQANREMMKKEAVTKKNQIELEKTAALGAHSIMVSNANKAQEKEFEEKKTKFKEKKSLIETKLNDVSTKSNEFMVSQFLHRTREQTELASQQTTLKNVDELYEEISSYSVLNQDRSFGFDDKLKAIREKKANTEEIFHKAQVKADKYNKISEEFRGQLSNTRLMKLVKKISNLQELPAGTGTSPTGSGTQPTAPPRGTEPPKTAKENLEAFYKEHVEKWEEAAENISGIVHGVFDVKGEKKGTAVETSDNAVGGVFAMLGAVKATLSGWNTFSRMYKRDNARKERGEVKDAADRWQDARQGLESIVDFIKSTLGAVGTWLNDGPAAILGIISNCAVLISKFVSIADSSSRCIGILRRKSELWEKMKSKRDTYSKDTSASQEEIEAYNLDGMWTRASRIKKKRDSLRQTLADSRFTTKHNNAQIATQQPLREKHKRVKAGYGNAYASLSENIVKEREWAKGQDFSGQAEEKKKYKSRIRLMKALEMVERYYELDAAHDRQLKLFGHAIEDSITESVSMVGNLANLSVVGASVGKILNVASSVYGLVRGGGSFIAEKVREKNGHAADKRFVRNEMSQTMFQSIKDITTPEYGWDASAGTFNVEEMKSHRLSSATKRMKHMQGMMTGLDLHLDPLMQTKDKTGFVTSLSSAFSQDGNA